MITRKELAKAAKRTLKKHFWILVVVCLIAAFVGSEFTETFSFFKMQMTDINNTDTNESQGVTLVTSDIDNRTKSAMLDAIVSVIMNNEEQGKEQSQTLIDKAKDNAGDILGRTSGILSSVVNNVSSGAVVFTIVDVVYGITGSRHLVVILLLCLALIFYFGIRYVVKMSYVVISRRMMNGYKWKCFCYQLSFIGWNILSFMSMGLVGVLYSNPYKTAFFTELYVLIRENAIKNNIEGMEMLSDVYLYERAGKEELQAAYADIYPYMNEDSPEERFDDDIMKSDIRYFRRLRKFLADWFGVILFNTSEEKKFEDAKAEQIKADRCKQEILGNMYPSRLFTLKEHRANFESTVYMRNYSIPSLILIFFVMSFIGWFWEVSSHLMLYHSFANRGVLHGPWLPIYGVGGLLILLLLKKFREKPAVEFVLAIILCGVVEYFTGLVLELTHNGQKWWDYTGFFLNLHGRICAEGLLAFGIGGMAIVYFVAPLLDNYFRKIKLQIIIPLCVALMMIFVADQLYTKKHPNVGEGITCLNIYDMYYYL